MEIRNVQAYGKTVKNDSRNQTELIIQWYVTIKMRVNTTKNGFTANGGVKALFSLITVTFKKLNYFLCSFSNVNFILG